MKLIKNQKQLFQLFLVALASIILIFALFYASLYLVLSWWLKLLTILLIAGLILWKLLKFSHLKKIFFILTVTFSAFILITIESMVEHDYAMWQVCLPAIRQQPEKIQNEYSQDGVSRSWYQHLECENNILPFPWDKQAKFSNNPPGFKPPN